MYATHLNGEMTPLAESGIESLIAELCGATEEHPDVSIKDENENCLSFYKGGYVVFENLEGDGDPLWCAVEDRESQVELARSFVQDGLGFMDVTIWSVGYGPE